MLGSADGTSATVTVTMDTQQQLLQPPCHPAMGPILQPGSSAPMDAPGGCHASSAYATTGVQTAADDCFAPLDALSMLPFDQFDPQQALGLRVDVGCGPDAAWDDLGLGLLSPLSPALARAGVGSGGLPPLLADAETQETGTQLGMQDLMDLMDLDMMDLQGERSQLARHYDPHAKMLARHTRQPS